MDNRTKRLGEEPIAKLLWSFSAPAIVGMIVNAIYNVVDRIFVGQAVGDKALAALSFAFPFMTAIMAVAMLVGLGGTSLVAISLGEGNRDKATRILANVFVFAGVSGGGCVNFRLHLFKATSQNVWYTRRYNYGLCLSVYEHCPCRLGLSGYWLFT